MTEVNVKIDVMTDDFASIWLEVQNPKHKDLIIGGFYREWTRDGVKNEAEQIITFT